MPISIMYDGTTIFSASTGATATLKTSGMFMADDVTVNAPPGAEGTPTATKGTVVNNSVSVTPQVTNTEGYITGETLTGAAITVSASELVSGTSNITSNGTFDITNYQSVSVNVSGGGGSGDIDALIQRTISGAYANSTVSVIGSYAFYACHSLTAASFPACTTIGNYAFASCPSLTTASFPVCKTIGGYAFNVCPSLTTVSFPVCTTIGNYAFYTCARLSTTSFPACKTIGSYAFAACTSLITASFPKLSTITGSYNFRSCRLLVSLYLKSSSLCTLSNSNAFTRSPIDGYSASAGQFGSIYVPSSLLASYKAATNWTYFSSRFVGQ